MRKNPSRRRRQADGFTLMEIVLVMTVLSVVVTVLAGVFVSNADVFSFLSRSTDDLGELRLAHGRIVLELRSIRDRTSIERATATSLEFTTSRGERIDLEYRQDTSDLTLNGRVLAGELAACEFRYYDSSGERLESPRTKPETDIWSIEVALTRSGASGLSILARTHPRNFL